MIAFRNLWFVIAGFEFGCCFANFCLRSGGCFWTNFEMLQMSALGVMVLAILSVTPDADGKEGG